MPLDVALQPSAPSRLRSITAPLCVQYSAALQVRRLLLGNGLPMQPLVGNPLRDDGFLDWDHFTREALLDGQVMPCC